MTQLAHRLPPGTARRWDLAVCYRIYPNLSRTPMLNFRDKWSLASAALHSFREGVGSLNARIWVVLDNCPPIYQELFRSVFDPDQLVIIPLPRSGNGRTFCKQLEILCSQQDSEFVYFAEDDYLYMPGA